MQRNEHKINAPHLSPLPVVKSAALNTGDRELLWHSPEKNSQKEQNVSQGHPLPEKLFTPEVRLLSLKIIHLKDSNKVSERSFWKPTRRLLAKQGDSHALGAWQLITISHENGCFLLP